MLCDSTGLRTLLGNLLPGLRIESTPRPSGQRVVYFCTFDPAALDNTEPRQRAAWGAVVLKASEGIHPSQIAYLQKEIEILNSLRSVHYPRLHWNGVFTHDPATGDPLPNRLFITIEERIDAPPLSAVSAQFTQPQKALALLGALVEALIPLWSHPQKLVHRDIKPDNLLVRRDGSVCVIDLGIVREEGSSGVTATGSPYGPCTALYASPEQARNDKKNISFRSDFFSLGVVIYEIIAGTHPFGDAGDMPMDVLDRVQNYAPPSLHRIGKANDGCSLLIERLMEKQPYRRPRTVDSLQTEISQLLT